mgnify:CR=1 FL=1
MTISSEDRERVESAKANAEVAVYAAIEEVYDTTNNQEALVRAKATIIAAKAYRMMLECEIRMAKHAHDVAMAQQLQRQPYPIQQPGPYPIQQPPYHELPLEAYTPSKPIP